jgi:hypothetical protein
VSTTPEEKQPTLGDMLRHVASDIDGSDPDNPIIAAAVVLLGANGEWAAMSSPGMSPFIGSALLDHAKTDLIFGGQKWTEFQPKKERPKPQIVK